MSSLTAEAFARLQKQLLPPGKVWNLVASVLEKVFLGAADELVRIDGRIDDLIRVEANPLLTVELIPEYEEMLEITPATGATDDERRAVIETELLRRSRFRPVDFQTTLAPVLDLADPNDVNVIEVTAAEAAAASDQKLIYQFYIFRDPADAGTPDIAVAQLFCDRMAPSHTRCAVIESDDFLCDDPESLTDLTPLGA